MYEVLWVKRIIKYLRIKWSESIQLYCNNKSVINIMHNLV
ncbi:unnamed protein product [Spirodela intermedia]|uniref:Uncharacterized protein n=1 Tax=Spirodela intermedia TaxID=51605 RepID=A0ABN7ECP5_SPIIN|nr:unnamed protein product [Spirodela intermedia]